MVAKLKRAYILVQKQKFILWIFGLLFVTSQILIFFCFSLIRSTTEEVQCCWCAILTLLPHIIATWLTVGSGSLWVPRESYSKNFYFMILFIDIFILSSDFTNHFIHLQATNRFTAKPTFGIMIPTRHRYLKILRITIKGVFWR